MFHNEFIFKKLFFGSQILFLMSLGLALKKTIYFYKLALVRNKKKRICSAFLIFPMKKDY